MQTARILNIIAIVFFIVSFILFMPILIYIAIAFMAASIIYWRVMANRNSSEGDN